MNIFPLARALSLWVDRHTVEELKKKKTLEEITWNNNKNNKEVPRDRKKNVNQQTGEQSHSAWRSGLPLELQFWTVEGTLSDSTWMALSFCWPSDFPRYTDSSFCYVGRVFFGLCKWVVVVALLLSLSLPLYLLIRLFLVSCVIYLMFDYLKGQRSVA